MTPAIDRSHARPRLILWLGVWIILFTLTHTRAIGSGRFEFDYADTAAHCVLYFLLTWLGARYLAVRGALTPRTLLGWAAVYAVYAVVDEWSQRFVGRTPSVFDWWADMVGVAAATLWLLLGVRRARLSEQAVPRV